MLVGRNASRRRCVNHTGSDRSKGIRSARIRWPQQKPERLAQRPYIPKTGHRLRPRSRRLLDRDAVVNITRNRSAWRLLLRAPKRQTPRRRPGVLRRLSVEPCAISGFVFWFWPQLLPLLDGRVVLLLRVAVSVTGTIRCNHLWSTQHPPQRGPRCGAHTRSLCGVSNADPQITTPEQQSSVR